MTRRGYSSARRHWPLSDITYLCITALCDSEIQPRLLVSTCIFCEMTRRDIVQFLAIHKPKYWFISIPISCFRIDAIEFGLACSTDQIDSLLNITPTVDVTLGGSRSSLIEVWLALPHITQTTQPPDKTPETNSLQNSYSHYTYRGSQLSRVRLMLYIW